MSSKAALTKFSANGSKEMQFLHLQWEELVAPLKIQDKISLEKQQSPPVVSSVKKNKPIAPPVEEQAPVVLSQESIDRVQDYADGLVTGCVTKKIKVTEENSIKFIGLVDLTRQIKGTLEVALTERDVVTKNGILRDIICIAAEVLNKFKEDEVD